MRRMLRAVVGRTPLHRVFNYLTCQRRAWQMRRTFRDWSNEDDSRRAFYSQFIAPGELVFDIGANLGNRTKVFHRLGALVIAVEPQPSCADFLLSVLGDSPRFHLLRKAIGAEEGEAEMLVCNAHMISSLSAEWVRSVVESGRFKEYTWDQRIKVPIDTLDNLITSHGRPTFIKIDVEGFEDQVIAGLHTQVRALSMEFTPEFMESTRRCIAHLCRIGNYSFQISLGESMEFTLERWVSADEILVALSAVSPTAFGDLYARVGGP